MREAGDDEGGPSVDGPQRMARWVRSARIQRLRALPTHGDRDLRGRVDVAVKILRSGLDAGVEERFRREGQILAKLRHPNAGA